MVTIGVLGIQGAVKEHVDKLNTLPNVNSIVVKTREELDFVQGLIIPGGESTAIGKLLNDFNLLGYLKNKISNGLPVWGTCAGMILLAKKITNDSNLYLEAMDIEVKRNAYGTQLDSFKTNKIIEEVNDEPIPLVFIRAPYVEKVSEKVQILCKVHENIVACREGNMLATSFHPELTEDLSFHKYFADIVKSNCFKV